jgi:hypothetical protein
MRNRVMTGSEKGHNSMTSGEQDPHQGRHRHDSGTWTPEVQHEHAPAHALLEPESPVETTVPGLRKFDLGTIPASVTPPRTWRKAAWFAIGASLAVVAGLAFAAAALVGKPKSSETFGALPGYPSLPLFIDTPPETDPASPVKGTSSKHPEKSSMIASPTHRATSTPQAPATPTGTGPPSAPHSSQPTEPSTPPAPPVRETTPKRAFATNDAKEIGDRTEAFYQQVTSNPDAAYALTAGDMHVQGEEAFKQRYADIKSIEVKQIGIDPNQGTTVSEVKITKKDGSTVTERRRLKFTAGSNPKISSEVAH